MREFIILSYEPKPYILWKYQMPSETWMITADEAVEMYARFLAARYGRPASKRARERAIPLRRDGDAQGYEIWNKVADTVDRVVT